MIVLLKPSLTDQIVLHCLESIKLQLEHEVLYQLLQMYLHQFIMTQVDDQTIMRLISQLIKAISRVYQKLLKHFKDNTILTFFVLPSAGLLPVLILDLNDLESAKEAFGSSL